MELLQDFGGWCVLIVLFGIIAAVSGWLESADHSSTINCCSDCGRKIGNDEGPKDGWQLEDGRTVCHSCCIKDTDKAVKNFIAVHRANKAD